MSAQSVPDFDPARSSAISVAIFAYNEEAGIISCLDNLLNSGGVDTLSVHVLINGCTDNTEQIITAYAQKRPNVVPVVIKLGDKANAWNYYVHTIAPSAELHVFMDGDIMVAPGSIAGLAATLRSHPHANAAAGLPVSGRSMESWRQKAIEKHEMMGGLYALRGSFVEEIRRRGIRLPIGIFGEDGLITMLVKWNLDPLGKGDPERVEACLEGGFYFDSLSPFRLSHWRVYRNRMMRYAVRRQQANMLYPLLWQHGIAGMPKHVVHLYRQRHDILSVKWNGMNTLFDYVAVKRIRKKIKQGDASVAVDEARHYS